MITFASAIELSHQNAADIQKPAEVGLGCNMRLYTYRITQSDSNGTFWYHTHKIFRFKWNVSFCITLHI